MNYVILIHKSKMTVDEVNKASIQFLLENMDGVNIKTTSIDNFVKLFNLGYSTEYQDYYIKVF
mgnify:CR=1 FL=1